ncbi:MAG: phage major capsid protein [Oscillospiraceae bacterium]|nr:phage major capsid protein [Oscillospiraceae bacterium]
MAINIIDRTGADALIPVEETREIIQGAIARSSALSIFRRLPNMNTKTREMPVLASLPMAYFVNGDTGMKQTTKVTWDKKKIVAEELAVIVPIPKNVLDDSNYDIWAEIRPLLVQAFGQKIDGAIIFGIDRPASWPIDVIGQATDAGNIIISSGDIFDDTLGVNGVYTLVEQDGFDVNGAMGSVVMKAVLRGLRDLNGRPLFEPSMKNDAAPYVLGGVPMYFPMNGVWDDSIAQLLVGDMSQAVYSIRQDISFEIFDTGVIQDPSTREIVYNLLQQDMVALRAVMRLGWQLPNPINALNTDGSTRCPFAVLKSDAPEEPDDPDGG